MTQVVEQKRPLMNRRKNPLLFVLAGILVLCGLAYAFTLYPHDARLRSYKRAFGEIQHPEDTERVAAYKFLGVLDHTRAMYKETFPQGCDYVYGEVREFTSAEETIESFYEEQTVQINGQEEGVLVWFLPLNANGFIEYNNLVEYGPNGITLLQYLSTSPFMVLDPAKSYYFIFLWEVEFSPTEFDFRCLL